MTNILENICEYKREHIIKQKRERSEDSLLRDVKDMPNTRGFCTAMAETVNVAKNTPPSSALPTLPPASGGVGKPVALIAEIKKASPSKGIIREDFSPQRIAETYAEHGATCLSVLTDQRYFQGDDAYISQVKEVCELPVLRKDFMLEPYQIVESRALDADCILLIMAALSDAQAAELFAAAEELGMSVLVEVHDKTELERATKLPLHMLGVNNRNLKTLEVNLSTSHELAPYIPENAVKIAESGIKTHTDIEALQKSGFYGYLVGESLMAQRDIGQAVDSLLRP